MREVILTASKDWFEAADAPTIFGEESERAKLFAALEAKATARNRKLIEGHPARPASVPAITIEIAA